MNPEKDLHIYINLIKDIIKTKLNNDQLKILSSFLVDRFINSTKEAKPYKETIVQSIANRIKNNNDNLIIEEFNNYICNVLINNKQS